MKYLFYFLFLSLPFLSYGQDEDCFLKKDFLIIQGTKDYNTALQTAKKASKALNIKLDLRDLIPDKDRDNGLTLPLDTCLKYPDEFNGDSTFYWPRGRYDDGIYISIEYSSRYEHMRKGYYIVMIGSGENKDKNLRATLKKVKAKYSDAYIQTCKVYMCCTR